MNTWKQTGTNAGRRSWQRSLGISESAWYWNGVWRGTTDTVIHAHLRTTRPRDVGIYAPDNVRRSWSSVKQRFPLIAAEVHEKDGLHFVVREENVTSLRENDVTFSTVSSCCDAERFVTENMDGPRPLSSSLLTRVYVLRRTDQPGHFHVVLIIAHCITDGCSTSTILRSFFQTLATSFDPCITPIEERLQTYHPMESRVFPDDMPLVKRRWRKAMGYAFNIVRRARLSGGHTWPGNFTKSTASNPAKSRLQVISFPQDVSALILRNCRHHDITLNAAYHVLSQVAFSRLLCRRYLRGEISGEEWEYRKRQPMLFIGPVNLRPYWNNWFSNGGSGEVGLNASFYHHVLPFMPLGAMANKSIADLELADGAPPFQDLMSPDRFLLRCELMKLENQKIFQHPLFLEICIATHSDTLEPNVKRAARWRQAGEHVIPSVEDHQPLPFQVPDPVFTQRGASLGDMDCMIPLDYPLPAGHELSPLTQSPHPHRAGYPVCTVSDDIVLECKTPRLHVESWQTHFHIRPGEIYLGAVTSRKRLQYFAFYDKNVHSADTIHELMGEMKEATLWYLGIPRQVAATEIACKL